MLDLLGGLDRQSISQYQNERQWNKTNVVRLLLALLGTTTKTEDQVKSRLLLDVVIVEGAAVFELLAGKDQTLLVRGNPAHTVRQTDQSNGRPTYPSLS